MKRNEDGKKEKRDNIILVVFVALFFIVLILRSGYYSSRYTDSIISKFKIGGSGEELQNGREGTARLERDLTEEDTRELDVKVELLELVKIDRILIAEGLAINNSTVPIKNLVAKGKFIDGDNKTISTDQVAITKGEILWEGDHKDFNLTVPYDERIKGVKISVDYDY